MLKPFRVAPEREPATERPVRPSYLVQVLGFAAGYALAVLTAGVGLGATAAVAAATYRFLTP